jgi:hypothetical protein
MEANMKRPEICLLILVIITTCSLASCSPGGSESGQINCSSGEEVCINVSAVEPIHSGDPVPLTIKVTSSKDISDLHVTLQTPAEVTTDDPQNWENYLSHTLVQPGYAGWDFAIKAGQTLTFNRVLHFPAREAYFFIGAEVTTVGRTLVGIDSFTIHMTKDGGKIFREGTSLPPYTPNFTAPAYGPGTPFPTFLLPTNTPPPSHITSPTSIQIVPLVATSTHTPYPGPTSYP